MKHRLLVAVILLSCSKSLSAMEPFVPPPEPQIVRGEPVEIQREGSGTNHIVHIKRATPASFTQLAGDYLAELKCSGEAPFRMDVRTWTSPRGAMDEELIFVTLPVGLEDKCTLTVLSREKYPWTIVFKGLLTSIPTMQ